MKKNILIVDDMQSVVLLLMDLLTRNYPDFNFISANDGIEACKLALREQPDLILMDWEMPGMNGDRALGRIKRHKSTSGIPVIILSGTSDGERLKHALSLGAIDFIKKPIDEIELIARVKSALALTESIQELNREKIRLNEALMLNETILKSILPIPILEEMKATGAIPPKRYKDCVVTFVDLVDFTSKTGQMSPSRLLKELKELFSLFDTIMNKYRCTRIKTIGDAYLAVSGMFGTLEDAESDAIKAAIEIRTAIEERNENNNIKWEITIGLYDGDVIGSSVSTGNLSFDIFGETVNMASRFQHLCEPMQINVSEKLHHRLKNRYKFIERTSKTVKGIGVMPMYYLHRELEKSDCIEASCMESILYN